MYQCQKCDFVFTSIEELDSHYYTVHPQELENVQFQQENYQASQPNSYPVYQQNQYQATQQNYDFSCYRCNKYFYDFESLNHHAETEHRIVVMPNVMPNVIQEQDGIPNVIVEKQIVMPQEMQNALQNVIQKPKVKKNVIQKPNVKPNVIQKQNVFPNVIQKKQIVMPTVIQKQNVTKKHIVMPNIVQKQNFMQRAIPNVRSNQAKFPLPPKRDRSPMVKIQAQAFKSQPQKVGIGMKYCFLKVIQTLLDRISIFRYSAVFS